MVITKQCVVCDSPMRGHGEIYDDVTNKSYLVVRCPECLTMSLADDFSDQEISSFYRQDYYSYGNSKSLPRRIRGSFIRMQKDPLLRGWASTMVPGMPAYIEPNANPKILDIGCGSGDGVVDLAALGWELHGTEISKGAAAIAASRGITMHPYDIASHEGESLYDVIRLWHVLEHVSDPAATLQACLRLLKPEGELIIGVPNNVGLMARLFKLDWYHLDVPRHLNHFNKHSIRTLLEQEQFEVSSVKTYADRGFWASLEKKTRRRYPQYEYKDRLPIIISEIPLNFVLGLTGTGDLMCIRARRSPVA